MWTKRLQVSEVSLVYKVITTAAAQRDAKEHAAHLQSQHADDAARKWLSGLHEKITILAEHPKRYPAIPEAEMLGFPYRGFVYHSHRIIYAVHEEKKQVVVHRIYHAARFFLKPGDIG